MNKLTIVAIAGLFLTACKDDLDFTSLKSTFVTNDEYVILVDRVSAIETQLSSISETVDSTTLSSEEKITGIKNELSNIYAITKRLSDTSTAQDGKIGELEDKVARQQKAISVAKKASIENKRKQAPTFSFVPRSINQIGSQSYLAYTTPGFAGIKMVKEGDVMGRGWTLLAIQQRDRTATFRHSSGATIKRSLRT